MTNPYFAFFVNDWLGDTARMSLADEGACIRLVCHLWRTASEDGIGTKDDDASLARIVGIPLSRWLKMRPSVITGSSGLFQVEKGMLRSAKLQAEWERVCRRSATNSVAVKQRWEKRKAEKEPDSSVKPDTNVLRNDTNSNSNTDSDSEGVVGTPTSQVSMSGCSNTLMSGNAREKNANFGDNEPTAAIAIIGPSPPARVNGQRPDVTEFERFWEAYPKQVARGAAYEAWSALRKVGGLPDIEVLIASIETHRRFEPNWRTDRFIPNPAKYLSEHRWLDVFQAQSPITDPLMCALAEGR